MCICVDQHYSFVNLNNCFQLLEHSYLIVILFFTESVIKVRTFES